MTLRVARIYFGLAVLALLGSFGAAMLLAAQFVVGEGIAVVLIALVGLASWATGRDRAWGSCSGRSPSSWWRCRSWSRASPTAARS
jgi:hypothetical protein